MKKKAFFVLAFSLAAVNLLAQENGVGGINQATSMVTSYFDPAV